MKAKINYHVYYCIWNIKQQDLFQTGLKTKFKPVFKIQPTLGTFYEHMLKKVRLLMFLKDIYLFAFDFTFW